MEGEGLACVRVSCCPPGPIGRQPSNRCTPHRVRRPSHTLWLGCPCSCVPEELRAPPDKDVAHHSGDDYVLGDATGDPLSTGDASGCGGLCVRPERRAPRPPNPRAGLCWCARAWGGEGGNGLCDVERTDTPVSVRRSVLCRLGALMMAGSSLFAGKPNQGGLTTTEQPVGEVPRTWRLEVRVPLAQAVALGI